MDKINKYLKNEKGATLVYILVFISFVMVLSTIVLMKNKQLFNSVIIQQLNTKAYYLSKETADIARTALINKDNPGNSIRTTFDDIEEIDRKQTIIHERNGETIGTTKIKLVEEEIEGEQWAVVYLTTTVPNYAETKSQGTSINEYTMYYEFRINIEKPYIQVFDILTEDKAN